MSINDQFRAFLEEAPDAFYAHDLDGKFIDVNRQSCISLGYTRETLLSMSIMDIDPTVDQPLARQQWLQLGADGSHECFTHHRRQDGSFIDVKVYLSLRHINDQKIVLALVHDLTSSKFIQSSKEKLSRLYKALSEVNQAIVRMEDETALFPLVCRIAVELGGLKMAWIARLNENDTIVPVISFGEDTCELNELIRSINRNRVAGDRPEAIAFRENRSVINNNQSQADTRIVYKSNYLKWGSVGAFPIYRAGKLFAVLCVYQAQAGAFDTEIIKLLNEMAHDISFALDNFDRENQRKQTIDILLLSEDKFSKTFRNSPNPISITTLNGGRIIEVNEAWTRLAGYSYDEVVGRTMGELGIWKTYADRDRLTAELGSKGRAVDFEFVFKTRTCEVTCLVSAEIVVIQNEQCIVLVAQDITSLKQAMDTIKEQKNFLNAILEGEPECVKVVSRTGEVIQMNSAGLAMLEVDSLEEVQAAGLVKFIAPEDKQSFIDLHKRVCEGHNGMLEFRVRGMRGTQRWLETHCTPLRNGLGEIIALLGVTRDITEKKQSDQLIWQQANFDLLTGLPNRFMFYDRLDQEIKKTCRDSELLALFFIDLDRFKEVNDTLGHQLGDILLVEAARRVVSCVRESDTVARLGGDEFTVMLSQLQNPDCIDQIARNIIAKLAEPFSLNGEQSQIYISASIGITLYPSDGIEVEPLLRNADQAMYVAKNAGRNRYSHFTPTMQAQAQRRLSLLNDLRGALSANQFVLYFQPIVDMKTGRIIKAEALLRWKHPIRGIVSPMDFIPLAEETGLIVPIGDWIFQEAARWASRWHTLVANGIQVSINMSPVEFQSEAISIANRLAYLHELGLSGKSVVIEITEGLLLNAETGITEKLIQLRDADIEVAIDDFGTGYSALSYLKKFDIDYLKLDQSFVRDLATDPSDMALSEAIIVMAHKLGLKVIAEGVETMEQRDLLANVGCDYAQGYLFSKPVAPAEFETLLNPPGSTAHDGMQVPGN